MRNRQIVQRLEHWRDQNERVNYSFDARLQVSVRGVAEVLYPISRCESLIRFETFMLTALVGFLLFLTATHTCVFAHARTRRVCVCLSRTPAMTKCTRHGGLIYDLHVCSVAGKVLLCLSVHQGRLVNYVEMDTNMCMNSLIFFLYVSLNCLAPRPSLSLTHANTHL